MKRIMLFLSGMAVMTNGGAKAPGLSYPAAHREPVADNYFGTVVEDPYRWLENDTSRQTAAWVAAEREVTSRYLQSLPYRDVIKRELSKLANYEKYGCPFKKHGKYYYFHNSGLQNQAVLYQADELGEKGRVFLDPNRLSDDGTVALQGVYFSENGKYAAYTVSSSGSDWIEIYVIDIATGRLTQDHIRWAKVTGVAWYGDGFYYSAYDAPAGGKEYSSKNENHKVFYHRIGTQQSADELVYKNDSYPLRFYQAWTDEREHALFLVEAGAGNGNGLYVKDLSKGEKGFRCVSDSQDYAVTPMGVYEGRIYLLTNLDAPNGRLVVADMDNPGVAHWKDVLPEKTDVLSGVSLIGGRIVAVYDKDASNHAYVYALDGTLLHEVALPAVGTVGFSGDMREKEAFFAFSSFVYPTTVFRYDMDTNTSEMYSRPEVAFDASDFVTEQVFFPSKDGTRIPMSLTYKKGLKRDGESPLWIYGYGGFNITLYPGYNPYRMFLIENGFVFAQVNLRGGNEYGEEWHLAGTKMQKQNVFDDFIAAAEYLIEKGYTSKDRIVAEGGSNGGLLVGACVNQRPDLYRVAFPEVGVMDMLRYHKFTIGWNWAPDYGTSEDSKEMFEYLRAYSPLHNIRNDGTRYPAIMVTTADHDDRVVPAHSFKYAAALQAADTGTEPKLIRIDSKAGHGGGKPTEKVIEEKTDIFSFAFSALGLKPVQAE